MTVQGPVEKQQPDRMSHRGYEGQKSLCSRNGPLISGSPFKISFFPRANFGLVLGGGMVWPRGGGGEHFLSVYFFFDLLRKAPEAVFGS